MTVTVLTLARTMKVLARDYVLQAHALVVHATGGLSPDPAAETSLT